MTRRPASVLLIGIMSSVVMSQSSGLEQLVTRFNEDRGSVERTYWVRPSAERARMLRDVCSTTLRDLDQLRYDTLDVESRIDWHLLRNEVTRTLDHLAQEESKRKEVAPLLPFLDPIVGLVDRRRSVARPDYSADARIVNTLAKQARSLTQDMADPSPVSKPAALRASRQVAEAAELLKKWFEFYDGYDPEFSWWMRSPHQEAQTALESYAKAIREKWGGVAADDTTTIVGDPIGRDALIDELRAEFISYTPEELFAIAEREFAWCQAELKRAADDMGLKGDTKAAMEKVKTLHVAPGEQPYMIQEMAEEAIAFLEARDLVTIPELCKQTWRMEMMSPERQLVSPFFLGGETILVSFPTDAMTHEQKLMSMRGNNRHFSRATVQHELIPGHHLQGFMEARYRPYRQVFNTPFWVEGWALYWEFLLWDLGFPQSPEDRVGMLFWRMHRCARILFSLGFHLGKMTPEECVELLVDKVGHERDNAVAEVRRSFGGDYPPLYQAAYMLGGLQIRALRKELVDSGRMTDREFHDAILQGGPIPIEFVRARLTGTKLPKGFKSDWKF